MKKYTASDFQKTIWKNGGGMTSVLAVFPAHADIHHFMWRLSMATISSNGPFSLFEHIQRSLAVINDASLRIEHQIYGQEEKRVYTLNETSDMMCFSGEDFIYASLDDKQREVIDINMMTRHPDWHHTMTRLTHHHQFQAHHQHHVLIYCDKGEITFTSQPAPIGKLQNTELLFLDEQDLQYYKNTSLAWDASQNSRVFFIEVFKEAQTDSISTKPHFLQD